MSLKRNVIASYCSQAYVTLIGLLMLPVYLRYMGPEAYGLVGFFSLVQACFGLLDFGLTPTVGRETARFHAGVVDARTYRQLFRALSLVFVTITVVGGVALWCGSGWVASRWLSVRDLPIPLVIASLQLISVTVALRWMSGLYRGVLTGTERLVWLSGFNTLVATLRFVAPILTMEVFGGTPTVFFFHQAAVAVFEVVALAVTAYGSLPKVQWRDLGWSLRPIRAVLKFSLTIAFTASVWVLLTQLDKLILSGILSLEDYGYFTLAVLVASGVMVLTGPLSTVLMPRMAKLHAEQNEREMIALYRRSTRWVSAIAGSAAIIVGLYSKQLLFVWTGNPVLADHAAPILRAYSIGNGLLAVAAFPYYLQYALGNLRYHLWGNLIMVLVLLPSVYLAATRWGALGAGYVWLFMNAGYLLGWVALVHRRLYPGLHSEWLAKDVLAVLALPTTVALLTFLVAPEFSDRLLEFGVLASVALLTSSAALIGKQYFVDRKVLV